MGIYSFCVSIIQQTLQQACKLCEQSWVYNETHIGDSWHILPHLATSYLATSFHILPHLATCQWQHDMERESFRLVHPGAAGPGHFLRPGSAGSVGMIPRYSWTVYLLYKTVYIFILWHTMDVWDGDLYSWFITVLLHIVPCIFQTWDDRTSGCRGAPGCWKAGSRWDISLYRDVCFFFF